MREYTSLKTLQCYFVATVIGHTELISCWSMAPSVGRMSWPIVRLPVSHQLINALTNHTADPSLMSQPFTSSSSPILQLFLSRGLQRSDHEISFTFTDTMRCIWRRFECLLFMLCFYILVCLYYILCVWKSFSLKKLTTTTTTTATAHWFVEYTIPYEIPDE